MTSDNYKAGEKMRRAVLGDKRVDAQDSIAARAAS